MKAEWRPIVGLEGRYEVSNKGQVRSLLSGKPRPMKLSIDKDGYVRVFLTDRPKSQVVRFVHRLVAMAFIDNPDSLETVNHIDEDKLNNDVSNLEWMTREDNLKYSLVKGHTFKCPKGHKVDIVNLKLFCKLNGLDNSTMCKVHLGKANHHKGWAKWVSQ